MNYLSSDITAIKLEISDQCPLYSKKLKKKISGQTFWS